MILYIISIPLNVLGTASAALLLFYLPSSIQENRQSLAYFRPAKSTSTLWNLVKTFCQTVIFWFSFLNLIPQILLAFERFFGLAQGLFVGVFLGSYFIFPYVFLGGWLWDTCVRPVEERELQSRFGADYDAYCREVLCWRFRIKKIKL
jgi:protein-S-isoprenylcysteine O-methyltransferase Ste14